VAVSPWDLPPFPTRGPEPPGPPGVLALLLLGLSAAPASLHPQSLLERTPNLAAGWVGTPGPVHFHLVHRFWTVDAGAEGKVVNSPTLLLAAPLPGSLLLGANYATNSLVAGERPNEWEGFLRWAPFHAGRHPVGLALTGARNTAAGSWDGEVTAALRLGAGDTGAPGSSQAAGSGSGTHRLTLLASVRRLGDAFARGEGATVVAGGAVLRLSEALAFSGDVGARADQANGDDGTGTLWGAGIQFRIPATPHTVSIHAANTRTGTLQGSSSRFRTTWGFEFTVPVVPGRYLSGLRGGSGGGTSTPDTRAGPGGTAGETVVVEMNDQLRFSHDAVRIRAGETVAWRNAGVLEHTVTADPSRTREGSSVMVPQGAAPFDSGPIRAGETFRHTFLVPGIYVYQCIPHEMVGMTGVVIVAP
jgi:plastocyanin